MNFMYDYFYDKDDLPYQIRSSIPKRTVSVLVRANGFIFAEQMIVDDDISQKDIDKMVLFRSVSKEGMLGNYSIYSIGGNMNYRGMSIAAYLYGLEFKGKRRNQKANGNNLYYGSDAFNDIKRSIVILTEGEAK